ncbi:sugar transport stp1 [Fusarium longipes]|uniref:Sugar transport stp1 n=1 Tax=Fusarium longipes TaxID=694270 RepID=A0A395RL99_9HYPO|nr:sugar transport stp1 [Fusarium longipes]
MAVLKLKPYTISQSDESLSLSIPDIEPVWDQPDPEPSPPPPEASASDDRPIAEIKAEIDARVLVAAEAARQHFLRPLYAHLPLSEIDWSLDGLWRCRVVGVPCYGDHHRCWSILKKHLLTREHTRNETALAAAWVEPSSTPPQPPTPVAPASEMATRVAVVEVGQELPGEEVEEALPESVKRPLDAQDEDDDDDDEPIPRPKRVRLMFLGEETNLSLGYRNK